MIPHVVSVDVKKRKKDSKKFIFPKKCPCGFDTTKEFNKVTKKFDAVRRCPDRGFECEKIAIEKIPNIILYVVGTCCNSIIKFEPICLWEYLE